MLQKIIGLQWLEFLLLGFLEFCWVWHLFLVTAQKMINSIYCVLDAHIRQNTHWLLLCLLEGLSVKILIPCKRFFLLNFLLLIILLLHGHLLHFLFQPLKLLQLLIREIICHLD